jgi:hypothetical protein
MSIVDIFSNPAFVVVSLSAIGGWVFTTWLRVKNGYPLEGSWGQTLKPGQSSESVERIKLLTTENAQLGAELSALKDRVQTLERIATDSSGRIAREIENLRH